MNLLSWLRQDPQPTTVLADAKPIIVGRGGQKWRTLVRTIESLEATRIEALDEKGTVLRATTVAEHDPADSEALNVSGVSDVQVFARLIADAYERGNRGSQPLLNNALDFIERQAQRLAAAEREIERLRSLVAKLQADVLTARAGNSGSGGEDSMLGQFLAGALAAQAGVPLQQQPVQPNGAQPAQPNGAPRRKA